MMFHPFHLHQVLSLPFLFVSNQNHLYLSVAEVLTHLLKTSSYYCGLYTFCLMKNQIYDKIGGFELSIC